MQPVPNWFGAHFKITYTWVAAGWRWDGLHEEDCEQRGSGCVIEEMHTMPSSETEITRPAGPDAPRVAVDAWRIRVVLLFVALPVFYLCMFLCYRAYDVDNPWFLSFSYDTFVEHIHTDQFMNVRFPGGMDGTHLFGVLGAAAQYGVARIAGWHQWPMAVLSTICVTVCLILWSLQLRRLGYGIRFIWSFVLLVGLSEPFVSAADKFRYEPVSLVLLSAGLLLVAQRRILLGMFVAALAVEVEPMAILGLIPAVILAYSMRERKAQTTWRMLVGIGLAATLFLCLHPDMLHIRQLVDHAQPNAIHATGGIFRAYFLTRARHIPELVIFAAAGLVYWRRRHLAHSQYLGLSAAVATLASVLVPHGNVSYMIFVYPLLVGMALVAFQQVHPKWIAALALLCLLPQYGWLAYMNRGQGYRRQDVQQVSSVIEAASQRIGVSDENVRIYGDYGLWFAHPHFYRAASRETLAFANQADLYLCYDQPPLRGALAATDMLYCPDLRKDLSLRLISTTDVRGNKLYLYARQN